MMWVFKTFDVGNIHKKLRGEVKSTREIDLTMTAGNNSIHMSVDRGKLLRVLVRIDEAIEEKFPGHGLIEDIKWREGRR